MRELSIGAGVWFLAEFYLRHSAATIGFVLTLVAWGAFLLGKRTRPGRQDILRAGGLIGVDIPYLIYSAYLFIH